MELNTAPCIPPWSPLSPWHRCTVERDRGGSWRLWDMLRWVFHALPWTAEACPTRCDARDSRPSRTAFPGYPVSARAQHRMNLLVHVTPSCCFNWQWQVVNTWVAISNAKRNQWQVDRSKRENSLPFCLMSRSVRKKSLQVFTLVLLEYLMPYILITNFCALIIIYS